MATACGGSNGTASGSGSADSSGGVGPIDTSGGAETTAHGGSTSTAAADGTGTGGTAGSTSTGGDDGPSIKLDLGAIPDVPGVKCDGGGMGGKGGNDEPDFSFIWVSNSMQGTTSKIDTQTLVEVGRYITRPDGIGDPSRTSVNLNGDVAVANRSGGVVKITARTELCEDPNNTSSGAADIKPWPDGCVAWYTPFNYASQRPVAWAPGDWDANSCSYVNTKLWSSGANASIDVLYIDGDTGVLEQQIPIPEAVANFYGIYGGASDGDGNFWGSQLGMGHLVFVDATNFDHQVWPMPISGYGMTVDEMGRAFTCNAGIARFDPDTEQWSSNANVGGGGGCMVDGAGTLWVGGFANNGGQMIGVDTETLNVVQNIPIPQYVHGISIDFYGYVWGVTLQQPWAYRVDPETMMVDTFTGLTGPYTYSDMTGYALSNAAGGAPSG
jgi:hypothetical protein